MFCIIKSKMNKQNVYSVLYDTKLQHFWDTSRIFPNKIQKFSMAILEILSFFKAFQVLENGIVNFHNFFKAFQNAYRPCTSLLELGYLWLEFHSRALTEKAIALIALYK